VAAEPVIGVVDDDPSLRTALVRLIRSLGYRARGFATADEFIESRGLEGCSCVVTDVQMPGMSGIDLTKLIASSRVPVIVISARSEPGLQERAFSSGAMCFLRKPIDTDALVEGLRRALKT
jgi:FixJ family two-component response regulator